MPLARKTGLAGRTGWHPEELAASVSHLGEVVKQRETRIVVYKRGPG